MIRKLKILMIYWMTFLFIATATYLWITLIEIALSLPVGEAAAVVFFASSFMASLFLWMLIGEHE